ncbi:hypothetical protein QQ008_16525 [Fulvivirgaceae bacterium BMA10]|uniref:Uncharacterized protein n=1 Tax=Splendidivirga corallicola TaxID=3051826 RepID=A0ABT8KSM0_9BACT|nr:hypothetical protein [Fulvivirgaceae bacterium BMA10]
MEETKEGTVERILKKLGQKVDDLIEKTKNSSGDLEEDLKKKVQELRKSSVKFEEDVKNFHEENKDKFKEVGEQLEKSAVELKKAVESVFSKKN